jgi:hypothetical protein
VRRTCRPASPLENQAGTAGAHLHGMDFVALGIVAVFFALSWGFVELCERL